MMNTQTKKHTIKLNLFDFLLIFFVILVIAGVGILFAANASQPTDETVIEYTVLVKELPEEMHIFSEPGQSVVDTIKLGNIGEVVSCQIVPATYDAFDQENNITVHGVFDDLVSAEFTFRANAQITDASYLINNVRVSVGAEVHFRTPEFIGFGFVTEVREISAE